MSDAESRISKIEAMNEYWEYTTDMVFDYVITDKALDNPQEAIQELERIHRFLKERVLARLVIDNPPVLSISLHKTRCDINRSKKFSKMLFSYVTGGLSITSLANTLSFKNLCTEPEVERFNLLKLVKLIYYIEKDGNAKNTQKQDDNFLYPYQVIYLTYL